MVESYSNISGLSREKSDSGAGVFTVTQINEYAKMLIDGNAVMRNVVYQRRDIKFCKSPKWTSVFYTEGCRRCFAVCNVWLAGVKA